MFRGEHDKPFFIIGLLGFFWSTTPSFSGSDLKTLREITIQLQGELTRVGCNPGAIDGQWGSKSRGALARFKRYAKLKLPYKDISPQTVDAIKQIRSRVCPKTTPAKIKKIKEAVKSKAASKQQIGGETYYFNNRTGVEYKTWADCSSGANMPWRCEKGVR